MWEVMNPHWKGAWAIVRGLGLQALMGAMGHHKAFLSREGMRFPPPVSASLPGSLLEQNSMQELAACAASRSCHCLWTP